MNKVAIIVFVSLLSAFLVGAACAEELLFGVTAAGDLVIIDPGTGQGTFYMDTGHGSFEGLEGAPSGLLYAILEEHRLGVIDPVLMTTQVIGDLDNVVCGEALALWNGTLYGAGDQEGGCRSESLLDINPSTGSASIVGLFGAAWQDIDGLAFSPDGQLYATDMDVDPQYRALLTVDPATGAADLVSLIEERVIGLVFSDDGILYGTTIPTGTGGPSDLVTIDPATGAVTTIGPTGFYSISGLAFVDIPTATKTLNWGAVKSIYR